MSPLFVIALAMGCGIYLFTAGFFLTRVELRIGSTCEADPFAHFAPAAPGAGAGGNEDTGGVSTDNGCWLPVFAADDGVAAAPSHAPFKRLVFLVIDGWRYDFAQPVVAGGGSTSHFRGKMPLLADTLQACSPATGELSGTSGTSTSSACSAQLYRFVADAPTVTAQRLKGLLSGSLPTFVDVSANFASGALGEDNWLVQLAARDERAAQRQRRRRKQHPQLGDNGSSTGGGDDVDRVFLGDDTWMHLFPLQPQTAAETTAAGTDSGSDDGIVSDPVDGATSAGGSDGHSRSKHDLGAPGVRGPVFTITRPFPSFNVRDLHTVDDGVLAHLLPAIRGEMMRRSPADTPAAAKAGPVEASAPSVVIGHFLGVDHVGHRYNTPDHPDMGAKLAQMDEAIRSVLDHLQGAAGGATDAAAAADPDTLFVVIGDHGMTSGGAHGGASAEETDAAMFMFAARPGLFAQREPQSAGALASPRFPTVRQIDMVPTLALLLGIPIPFASIGAVFEDVAFQMPLPRSAALAGWQELHDALTSAQATAVNAAQLAKPLQRECWQPVAMKVLACLFRMGIGNKQSLRSQLLASRY